MIKTLFTFSLSFLFAVSPAFAKGEGKSDNEIRDIMIAQSIAAYDGVCPCPYSIMRSGKPCNSRSAWSKPGGAEPLCYRRDVTDL